MALLRNRILGPQRLSNVYVEEHATELGITNIPIERGSDASDHAYVMPKKVTIKSHIGGPLDGRNDPQDPAIPWQILVRFQETRVPFTFMTGLSIYNNMLVKRLDVSRSADNSQILEFTAELQEIKIVNVGGGLNNDAPDSPRGGQAEALHQDNTNGTTQYAAAQIISRGDRAVSEISQDTTSHAGRVNNDLTVAY